MKPSNAVLKQLLSFIAGAAVFSGVASAEELFHFKFDEGSGGTIGNTAGTLQGMLGTVAVDPNNDVVTLQSDSPSGQPGDGSFSNLGNGFLIATDTNRVLDITNGPITLEAWIKINSTFGKPNEGIVSYGGSYKLGLKSGRQVFTLLGIVDITNSAAGVVPWDQWVHLAAAWTPGVGVDFYVNGSHQFVEKTNLRARPLLHPYLSMGSEGFNNTLVGSFDRIRVHNAVLSADQLDTDPTTPKAPHASTIVSYNFNETSFPVTNSLNPPLPAVLANDIVAANTGRPFWTSGVTGDTGDTALAFYGTNRASASDPSPVIHTNSLNGNYTIETWAELPVNYAPAARAIMFQYTGIPGFAFSINTDRTLHTTAFGKIDRTSTVQVPNDGGWHHLAVVHRDGVAFEFYVDGTLRQSIAYTQGAGVNQTAKVLTIGMAASGANVFTGTLDRVRFSNEALSPSEFDYPAVPGFPFFGAQPSDLTVTVTSNATLTATAYGQEPLTYQWRFSPSTGGIATNLPGQTSPVLAIANAQLADSGFYSVIANNPLGSVTSSVAHLVVSAAPVITTEPANVVRVVGEAAEFTVTASPAPGYEAPSYQWYYAGTANPEPRTPLAGANGSTLTLNNLQLAQQGYYSVVVSNSGGLAESTAARLTITSPGTLTRLWEILPGERTYITPRGADAGTTDLERGMAYNPATDHLLIGARSASQAPIKGIYILRASDGVEVGQLPNPEIVTGGTIYLTRVVAAEDGAIFACNFGTLSDSNPLKIYRWANETAQPTIAYQGNPVSGTGLPNQQWGKNMSVHGSGMNTKIILDTRNFVAVFTTTDGATFTPSFVLPAGNADDWNDGLAWGANGASFWGKADNQPLFHWSYSNGATNASILHTYTGLPSPTFGNFSFSTDHRYMVGLNVQAGPDAVELYDVSNLDRGPMLVDAGLFTANNSQTVGYGNVYIANSRVLALNPNNGVVAFSLNLPQAVPTLGIRRATNGDVTLFWPASETGYILESTVEFPTVSWTTIPHTTVGGENVAIQPAGTGMRFFRLRK